MPVLRAPALLLVVSMGTAGQACSIVTVRDGTVLRVMCASPNASLDRDDLLYVVRLASAPMLHDIQRAQCA